MRMTIGSTPKKSGELLPRDLANLHWFLIVLSKLKSVILTSSVIMTVFLDYSFLIRGVPVVFLTLAMPIPWWPPVPVGKRYESSGEKERIVPTAHRR